MPLPLSEIWAHNSKPLENVGIKRDGAWHGGGQVGDVAPVAGVHRDVARMVVYMLASAST